MSKQLDGAFLLWARDWLTDEHVVLMSPAAKGVFIDLLCHCWLEGSIPACSEHLARIARVDAQVFADVWRELCPRFAPHPSIDGRLVNERMDSERAKADARRKSRSDKAAKAAAARWSNAPRTARGNARRNAPSIADASGQAVLGDAHQSNPSTSTPLPPEHPKRASARGANPARPEPEAEPETGKACEAGEQKDPVIQLQRSLLTTPYRWGLPTFVRRRDLLQKAADLHATGLTPVSLQHLVQLDAEKASTPGALLATWLDANTWRDVLAEKAMKTKERGAMARAVAAQPDDLLEGIYGGEPPKMAGSVVGQVLAKMGVVGS